MWGLHRDRNKKLRLYLGRFSIRADRWPWMTRTHQAILSSPGERIGDKYGWLPTKGMGRFGGGWNWRLGIDIGGSSLMINLLFGYINVNWYKAES